MAFQPSVVEYFNNRKRPAADELKKGVNPSKVLVLDSATEADLKGPNDDQQNGFVRKLVYTNKEVILPNNKPKAVSNSKSSQISLSKGKKVKKPDGKQMDIRKTLLNIVNRKVTESSGETSSKDTISGHLKKESDARVNEKPSDEVVPFHIKGNLSPVKSRKVSKEAIEERLEEGKTEPQSPMKTEDELLANSRKELNLGNLKKMMSRSSRLEEMKAALQRFNNGRSELSEIQARRDPQQSPSLDIEFQVPASPLKTPKKMGMSPVPQGKLTPSRLFDTPPTPLPPSPLKSPLKSPAFQKYQALVTEGRPVLVLPFKYRALAELFRCVDTVASMLHNRRETITLSKLRPGVQEISRKNLTEYHLGQIKTLFPDAFEYSIEKMRALGSTEKHELVIKPILPTVSSGEGKADPDMMSPSVLLTRRRTLYNALLELTKDHHEEFLSRLVPPMSIPRSRLTRWHPEFPVDDVPDILSAALPQPPNTERVASAKDVLEKARNLFVVNPRMARALQKVSENTKVPPATISLPTPSAPSPTPSSKPALHGVPASLLERVRAKQAARAMEAMTRTPAQAQEAVRITRLPDMARILRNLFVAEKKSILPRDSVLIKLADSCRENLSHSELDEHLKLLSDKAPGWITFCNLRKTDFVRLSRNADMNRVITRLNELAADKCL
ncbi:replication licensing factor Cdt1 [Homalodisca vitripennis]|nr:replication licensing factor Cdt1 [Homalodisca vitripennis]